MTRPVAVIDTCVVVLMLDGNAEHSSRRVHLATVIGLLREKHNALFLLPAPAAAELDKLESTLEEGVQLLANKIRSGIRIAALDHLAADEARKLRRRVNKREGQDKHDRQRSRYDAPIAACAKREQARWLLTTDASDYPLFLGDSTVDIVVADRHFPKGESMSLGLDVLPKRLVKPRSARPAQEPPPALGPPPGSGTA